MSKEQANARQRKWNYALNRVRALLRGEGNLECCDICGKTVRFIWWADTEIWYAVRGDRNDGGTLCMACFDELATSQHVLLLWSPQVHSGFGKEYAQLRGQADPPPWQWTPPSAIVLNEEPPYWIATDRLSGIVVLGDSQTQALRRLADTLAKGWRCDLENIQRNPLYESSHKVGQVHIIADDDTGIVYSVMPAYKLVRHDT